MRSNSDKSEPVADPTTEPTEPEAVVLDDLAAIDADPLGIEPEPEPEVIDPDALAVTLHGNPVVQPSTMPDTFEEVI